MLSLHPLSLLVAGLLKRVLEFMACVPAGVKNKLTVVWVPKPRAAPLGAGEVDGAAAGLKAVVSFPDAKAAADGAASTAPSVTVELADHAMILYTRYALFRRVCG